MNSTDIFIGANVDEAVAAGLTALGLSREQVSIEVLDEGSPGFLGLGARPARVRVIPLRAAEPGEAPPVLEEEVPPEEQPDPGEVARAAAAGLLEQLGIHAEVESRYAAPEKEDELPPLILEVRGEQADVLIGRHGETLAAFQHIVRLLVSRQLASRFNLVVDVNGYKRQRERTLRGLARRMADRAVRTGRVVRLDPMPAYERRIVHLALRDHPDVRTESVGEGRRRRVTIIPRKD